MFCFLKQISTFVTLKLSRKLFLVLVFSPLVFKMWKSIINYNLYHDGWSKQSLYLTHKIYSHKCLIWQNDNFHHNQQYCHYNIGFQKSQYLLTFLKWISFVNSISSVISYQAIIWPNWTIKWPFHFKIVLHQSHFHHWNCNYRMLLNTNVYFKVCWKWHRGGNLYDILEKWCMSFLRERVYRFQIYP